MKKITLLRLTLENFKACALLTLNFNGRDAVIYGANGAGKTTVYNALTWLLFDKIAGDDGTVMTAPDIKPNGADGEVADHTAISSVEAEFSVDDGTVTLRREYKERWESKRGASEKSMNGHTSNYFWNGVPVQLQDFKERLSDTIASEDLFWALSNVHWFGRGMDWKARRNMLADVCGLPDDMAVLAANAERFPGLAEAMGELPFADFRKKVDTDRGKLEKTRNTYPARLDEIRKTIHQYDTSDFAALRSMRDAREADIRQKTDDLSKLDNGTLLSSTRNELEGVRNKARELELENQRYRQNQTPPPATGSESTAVAVGAGRRRAARHGGTEPHGTAGRANSGVARGLVERERQDVHGRGLPDVRTDVAARGAGNGASKVRGQQGI